MPLTTLHRKRGIAVAAGFALKLFPGLLAVALLLRRERRASRAMIAGTVAALVLPWAVVAIFLHGPSGAAKGSAWTGTPATLSWSLPSLAVRLLDPARRDFLTPTNWMLGTNLEHFHLPPRLAAAGLAISILMLAVGLFMLIRSTGLRIREEQAPWAISALVSLALIASPVCWTHYQVLQYPGVALLLIWAWRHRRWAQLGVTLAIAASIYPLPMHMMDALSRPGAAASLNVILFWSAVPPLASFATFAMQVRRAARVALPHALPQRSPVRPGYTHLPTATPLVPLRGAPLSPSRAGSSH